MNIDKKMSELDYVSLERVLKAAEAIKLQFPDRQDNEIMLSFEYLIGSFYPNVFNNIKSALNEAHTAGYIQGSESREI